MRNPATVHNPLLKLPVSQKLKDLPSEAKECLRNLLVELSSDARARAEHAWCNGKAPMAAYWKAVSVYAKHTARICR
ncbi:hypothetical protein AVDCRST_MAG81-3154 [uncultured Synechococcales cyanobacterium]|uniref:Uncharacterized protein n=1 Tax=uncultured Synechococcales cyanobacterium TaxID=1936017 RepID=A0A6J4VMR7_9CYAN|nr:hypothetical protein AVDCRST_MAG81-3154 [uncultured Synechococcales cyanobacterium]